MNSSITVISSKATAAVLATLAAQYASRTGDLVLLTSVGGVDAVQRVLAGEVFDAVLLAGTAIDRLIASGRLLAPRRDLLRSAMVAAVPAAAPATPVEDEAALRSLVASAQRIGYSTGPSGDHLLRLIEQWGLTSNLEGRLLQAPPGVPVARLLAEGAVELGFQQASELLEQPGVRVLGPLPGTAALSTLFGAALHRTCAAPDAVDVWLQFVGSETAAATIRRHGMEPA